MPITGVNGNSPILNPQADAPAAPAQVQPKAVPGFDPAGAPLGDADVWNLFVGRGDAKRAVNTAHAQSKSTIDGWEQRELLKLLQKDPKEFLQRLMADSMNGSPVTMSYTKELEGFGIGHIEFRAENGHVDTTASIEVFNKSADKWLKPYLAKDPRAKGTRSTLALQISGDLNKDAGIDNIKLEARAANLPAFSAEKLKEIDKIKAEIKEIMEGKGRAREKRARVQEIVGRAIERASEIPINLILGLITDRHELEMTFKEKTRATMMHAETGKGSYALTFTDILDGEHKDEADLEAKVTGKVSEDKERIEIGEAKIYTTENLSMTWGEENQPQLHYVDPKTGEKTKLDDHVGEIMMYLPMALALMNGRNFL